MCWQLGTGHLSNSSLHSLHSEFYTVLKLSQFFDHSPSVVHYVWLIYIRHKTLKIHSTPLSFPLRIIIIRLISRERLRLSNAQYFLTLFFKEPRRLARVFFCCSLEKQDFSLGCMFPDRCSAHVSRPMDILKSKHNLHLFTCCDAPMFQTLF